MSSPLSSETQWIGALIWSALTVFIATAGLYTLFRPRTSFGGSGWYKKLRKPPLTPPGWLFAVVWPILYGLITAAIWVYWRRGSSQSSLYNLTLALYITQLVLNGLWILLFFILHLIGLAAIDICIILVISAVKLVLFGVQSAWLSFGLFFPYVLWLAYALYLNAGIAILNT